MRNRTEDQIEIRRNTGTDTQAEIRLTLIRHGTTLSNKEGRYLGKTDEALNPDGIGALEKSVADRIYPTADVLFSGPMKRCLETAGILYPGQTPIVIPEWTEMDFGAFEGHNYQELSGNPAYQRWIDSGGTLPFPEGESREEFIRRSVAGYEKMVYHMKRIWERSAVSGQGDHKIQNVSAVVHGGNVMALLAHFLGGEYFDYQVKCGQGYSGRLAFPAGGGAPQWKGFRPLSEAAESEATVSEAAVSEATVSETTESEATVSETTVSEATVSELTKGETNG